MRFVSAITSIFGRLFETNQAAPGTPAPPYDDGGAFREHAELFGGIDRDGRRSHDGDQIRMRSANPEGELTAAVGESNAGAPRSRHDKAVEAPKPYCYKRPPATRVYDSSGCPTAVVRSSSEQEA